MSWLLVGWDRAVWVGTSPPCAQSAGPGDSCWQPAWCDLTINVIQGLESTQGGLKTNEGRLMCYVTPLAWPQQTVLGCCTCALASCTQEQSLFLCGWSSLALDAWSTCLSTARSLAALALVRNAGPLLPVGQLWHLLVSTGNLKEQTA